jgi:glycine/D-amino acid oxidase-like deaminating enzyme/nitrite reductase/ring-hydroxylating ferredoxin subunit
MYTKSFWNQFASAGAFPALNHNAEADVAVIGGGITGISTALLLSKKGLKVIVLESMRVGGGTTSHSTGNLYFTVDKNLSQFKGKYDEEVVRNIISSRSAAMDQIEKWIQEYRLDCNFHRVPWIFYSGISENNSMIEDEYNIVRDAGVPVNWAESVAMPATFTKGVVVTGQAQFNPVLYVEGLAKAAQSGNLQIFENTTVLKVKEEKEHVKLETTGGTVTARYAVHATHTPKGVKVYHTLLGPYREYGIACSANEKPFPEGIFWGYYEEGKKYSIRLYERGGQRHVLVIGEPHKVGQSDDNMMAVRNLEDFAARHLGLTDVAYRWGGQHYRPADLLPYIGREGNDSNVFVATGFSTDGLVYGTLAGMLIADEIVNVPNKWAELYSAHRFTPLKSAKQFLKENINVAGEFLKVLPGLKDTSEFNNIESGSGAIVEKDSTKIAAYRDEAGELTLVSAVCPHMKCIVNWNNAEKTWDCPCHGSRFKTDGTVLEGPAFHALQKISMEGDEVKKEGH